MIILNLKDAWNLGKIVSSNEKQYELDIGNAIMKIAKQIDDCISCEILNKGRRNRFTFHALIKLHFKHHLIKVDEE